MADDNILAEEEFDISLDGQSHKVKATAVFLVMASSRKRWESIS
jgi:hypothetical protein